MKIKCTAVLFDFWDTTVSPKMVPHPVHMFRGLIAKEMPAKEEKPPEKPKEKPEKEEVPAEEPKEVPEEETEKQKPAEEYPGQFEKKPEEEEKEE